MSNTLSLTVTKKWFDMIASGIKKEEYREVKPFWENRLFDFDIVSRNSHSSFKKPIGFKQFDQVKFTNGYRKDSPTITMECLGIEEKTGNPEWGACPNVIYYVIKLGKIKVMNKNKHTPGPWTVNKWSHNPSSGVQCVKINENGAEYIGDAVRDRVFTIVSKIDPLAHNVQADFQGAHIAEVVNFSEESEANAARIVACVNALEGVPSESMSEVAKMVKPGGWHEHLTYMRELETDREELINALKDLTRFAAEDFKPGYAPRSDQYTNAYLTAVKLVEKHQDQPEGWLKGSNRSPELKTCPECKGLKKWRITHAGPVLLCGLCKGKGKVPA